MSQSIYCNLCGISIKETKASTSFRFRGLRAHTAIRKLQQIEILAVTLLKEVGLLAQNVQQLQIIFLSKTVGTCHL